MTDEDPIRSWWQRQRARDHLHVLIGEPTPQEQELMTAYAEKRITTRQLAEGLSALQDAGTEAAQEGMP